MKWIELDDYKKLPVGDWLVRIDKDRKPYHVASVTKNKEGHKLIIVGSHFSFDMGALIAYTKFDRYEPPTK